MADAIAGFILLSCCCVVPLLFIVFILGVVGAGIFGKGKYAVPDFVRGFWNWLTIFTGRSLSALFFSMLFMLIAVAVPELSLFASISIFLFCIVFIFIFVAFFSKIYFHIRKGIFGKDSMVTNTISRYEFNESETSQIKLRVKTGIPLGYILKIVEKIPEKLGGDLRGVATVSSDGVAEFESTIPNPRRGTYEIGPIHLTYQDVFGFSRIKMIDPSRISISILPEIPYISKFQLVMSKVKSDKEDQITTMINTEDYYSTRPYIIGDDVRRLHWKLSAKTDELVIRLPEMTTINYHTLTIVLLNTFPKMRNSDSMYSSPVKFKSPPELALDNQIRIAGAIMDFGLRNGIPVKLYYQKDRKYVLYEPPADNPKEWKLKLAEIAYTHEPLDKETLSEIFQNEGSVILTTSETDPMLLGEVGEMSKETSTQIYYCPYSYYIDSYLADLPKYRGIGAILYNILFTKPYFKQTTFGEKAENLFLRFIEKYNKDDIDRVAKEEQKVVTLLKSMYSQVKVLEVNEYGATRAEMIVDLIENEY